MKKIAFLICGVAIMALSCQDDDVVITNQAATLCDSLDVLYTKDVKSMLDNAGCSGDYCHGGGAGGFTITDYTTTKATASNAKFLKAIRHETGASPMPKGGNKLSDEQITMLECWVQNGFKE
jgi:hypothetical protein